MPAVQVSDLRKAFESPSGERIEVLRGVSLSVESGESVAIMGASGAGKTTLLHLLAGLESADHGDVIVASVNVTSARAIDLTQFRNQHIGLVFQFHHLLADLTAEENVSLPLLIGRRSAIEATSRAKQLLADANLAERSSHLITDLSGGEQQRVAVCRALSNQPSVVLADEPTGNLDVNTSDVIARKLVSYARENSAALILATHNPSVAKLCDRTLLLEQGRVANPSG